MRPRLSSSSSSSNITSNYPASQQQKAIAYFSLMYAHCVVCAYVYVSVNLVRFFLSLVFLFCFAVSIEQRVPVQMSVCVWNEGSVLVRPSVLLPVFLSLSLSLSSENDE